MALAEDVRLKAKEMLEEGCSLNAIAAQLGVSSSTVGVIRDSYGMTCRKANREKNPDSTDVSNICWECKKATGFCPWCEVDQETGRIRWGEVPGWTTEIVLVNGHPRKRIIACPMFERG